MFKNGKIKEQHDLMEDKYTEYSNDLISKHNCIFQTEIFFRQISIYWHHVEVIYFFAQSVFIISQSDS